MKPDTHGSGHRGWIAVDLDGTLAVYHGWVSASHIGPPIEPMVARVKQWLRDGQDVRIFTARVVPGKPDRDECLRAISDWSMEVFGIQLPMTSEKDPGMLELWDDRCVQVIPNTGRRADSSLARIGSRLERYAVFWAMVLFVPIHSETARRWRCRYNMHDYHDWEHGQPEHMTKQPCVRCGTKFGI